MTLTGLLSFGLPQAQISGNKWTPIGPAPISGFFKGGVSGRATAVAVNPFDGNQVWLGTASGGIWFSPDAGTTWYPMTDGMGALAIGAIAVAGCDATRCTKVFAGTGENAIRRDTYYGRGLLVGTYITGDDPPTFGWFLRQGDANVDFNLGSINDVIFVPNPLGGNGRVIVTLSSGVTASATESTVTAPESATGGYGIYSSNDEGLTWSKLNVAFADGERPTDLEIDPNDPDTLYAGFLGVGAFKSEDGGTNWCPLSDGIPFQPGSCADATGLTGAGVTPFDHVELAVFGDDPSILYATLGHCTDPLLKKCVPSLYKTTDGGLTWTLQYLGTAFPSGDAGEQPQGYSRYTHALTIHPNNPSVLYMGGIRLWRTNNSGVSLFTFDQNNAPGSSSFGDILHADHHEVLWDPSTLGRIYNANDGGFAYTNGPGWYPANDGLQITGFQSMSASALTDRVIGGTQDNSAAMWTGSKTWTNLPCCGDAGSTIMDADEPMTMYALSEYGDIKRSLNGGASWCAANAGLPNKEFEPRAFYAPMEQDPSSPHPLYWGGQKLYMAQPAPGRASCSDVTWSAVSPALQTGPQPEIYGGEDVITAIGISESNSGRIYLGYYGGGMYKTDAACDDGSCWSDIGAGLPDAPITRIAVHASLQDTVLVTLSGFNAGAHVWKTTDGGANWSAGATGVPAGIPANTIHFEPGSPAVMWLGLDGNPSGSSIYRSTDTGANWTAWSLALPNVPVYDIALDPSRNRAFAGTHGRGAFMLSGNSLLLGFKEPEIPVDGRPYDFFFMGWLFPEGPGPCTAELMLQDGTTCAAGDTDAMGVEIMADAEGRLMTGEREMVWGCFGGGCIGGAPMDDCMQAGNPLREVVVTCDGEAGMIQLADAAPVANPPSSRLGVNLSADPGIGAGGAGASAAGATMAGSGAFHLASILQNGDGTSRSLCTVHVPILAGEMNDAIVSRAADLINGSQTCMAEGLTADLTSPVAGQEGEEDVFARNMSLLLSAPGLTGGQLLALPLAGPGEATDTCFDVTGLGVPVNGQLQGMALKFMTDVDGAMGGQVSLSQESALGACGVNVTTLMGDTAMDIASRVAAAINMPEGPSPDCLLRHHAGDNVAVDHMVNIVAASSISLCITDPGVGFQLVSEETDNLHPNADINTMTATECTSSLGSQVLLDGSLSHDPNSSPGTNDDIVIFEWYLDYGLLTETLLGTGEFLNVQLALGTHNITLKVIDSQGLEDSYTGLFSVVDTVQPALTGSATPNLLFPAHHGMQTVTTSLMWSDACTVDANMMPLLMAALSDEADDAPGPWDGATTNDIQDTQFATPDFSVRLRAERDSSLAGRTYTLTYSVMDGSGNSNSTPLTVFVPLNVDGSTEPIIITPVVTPLGTVLEWTPHEGATAYNVIRVNVKNFDDLGDDYSLGMADCVEAMSPDLNTLGDEDPLEPGVGEVHAYLVESRNGYISGYGTESALKWRLVQPPDPCAGP